MMEEQQTEMKSDIVSADRKPEEARTHGNRME